MAEKCVDISMVCDDENADRGKVDYDRKALISAATKIEYFGRSQWSDYLSSDGVRSKITYIKYKSREAGYAEAWEERRKLEQRARRKTASVAKGTKLSWIEVNEVTWKLTDGTMSVTPACHGKWPSFKTPKAILWLMEIGWVGKTTIWYVAGNNVRIGPFNNLNAAKLAGFAFAIGEPMQLPDDARQTKGPVDLNAIATREIDRNFEQNCP